MNDKEFAQIAINNGARRVCYVGGCVRDELIGRKCKDHDIVIEGITPEIFEHIFPNAVATGKKFPVYRMQINDEIMEVAFARKEKKISTGHSGYDIDFSSNITLEEDLYRRDLTMNAIAKDILTNEYIDPYNGKQDIASKTIRAVSKHFMEDAVRALRAARQASVLNFNITDDTIEKMNLCSKELLHEPQERIVNELEKALHSNTPSTYFRLLQQADILKIVHPQIYALIGQSENPIYHPEGDSFEHTMQALDKCATLTTSVKTRFAVLFHDIGKGKTPKQELPKHYGHDHAGAEIINALPQAYPSEWKKAATFVAKTHMGVHGMKKWSKIIHLYEDMKRNSRLSMEEYRTAILSDMRKDNELPWFLSEEIMNAVLGVKVDILPNMKVEAIKNKVLQERTKVLKAFVRK